MDRQIQKKNSGLVILVIGYVLSLSSVSAPLWASTLPDRIGLNLLETVLGFHPKIFFTTNARSGKKISPLYIRDGSLYLNVLLLKHISQPLINLLLMSDTGNIAFYQLKDHTQQESRFQADTRNRFVMQSPKYAARLKDKITLMQIPLYRLPERQNKHRVYFNSYKVLDYQVLTNPVDSERLKQQAYLNDDINIKFDKKNTQFGYHSEIRFKPVKGGIPFDHQKGIRFFPDKYLVSIWLLKKLKDGKPCTSVLAGFDQGDYRRYDMRYRQEPDTIEFEDSGDRTYSVLSYFQVPGIINTSMVLNETNKDNRSYTAEYKVTDQFSIHEKLPVFQSPSRS